MSGDFYDRSSDLRELLNEDSDLNDSDLDGSDIEADDVPSNVPLLDYSSGSGEEYKPSESEPSSDEDVVRPSRTYRISSPGPSNVSQAVAQPIVLQEPPQPKWVRVYPPEPESKIEDNFTTRNSGPKHLPPRNSKPIEYFSLYFTVAVYNHIVRHTNYYAQSKRESGEQKKFSRMKRWIDVTYQEIKKYFAILINMGLTRRKNMKDYWDSSESQTIPFYHNTMSYNRFILINSNLHLTLKKPMKKGEPGYDPWVKIRYIFDHLNATFKKHFIPTQNVCIDESMIGMKNRCAFIQYMPNKKHARYGIKKFEVCDSKTGYIMHTELYSGNDLFAGDPHPFVEKVILNTMEKANLLDKYHHVITDQFYTKYPTAKKLFDRKTYMTGTINKQSKFISKTLTGTNLSAKQSIYFRKEEVLMVGFRQKANRKPVYLLTTAYHAEDKLVKSKKGLEGIKPLVIHKYNQDMGGVDVSDKSIYHTSCTRMTSKYWKKIFFNFVDMSMYNAYVLYKSNSDRPKPRKAFIIDVLESLVEDAQNPAVGPGGDVGGGHSLAHLPGNRLRLCAVCESKQKNSRSRFWCPGCNCGVHRECFPLLKHFWRPVKFGRKRKQDDDSD